MGMIVTNKQKTNLASFFANQPEIIVAYLFGSQAKDTAGPMSDIDLAVLVSPAVSHEKKYPFGYRAHLITELSRVLHTNELDVIVLNEVPPLLKFQVIYHGEVIFCRSKNKRLDFQLQTFNEYQDIRPMLAVQYDYMLKRLEKKKRDFSS